MSFVSCLISCILVAPMYYFVYNTISRDRKNILLFYLITLIDSSKNKHVSQIYLSFPQKNNILEYIYFLFILS